MKLALLLGLVLVIEQALTEGQSSDVVGKLVVGYQGWFGAPQDGSPILDKWLHWAVWGEEPSPGHVTFELYPDVREYQKLYQTKLGNLRNGKPAQLFSSWDDSTIDLHFKWMQDYNIETVALQRFPLRVKSEENFAKLLNGIANKVRVSAEKYNRKFYITWDVTGWNAFGSELIEDLEKNLIENLKIFDSRAYARHNGKPVVSIWGFGFIDRPNNPNGALNIVNELKRRGYYVIGGVPITWRTGTGSSHSNYLNVYSAFNMLQPWSVGSFKDVNGAKTHQTLLREDLTFCTAHNIDYQPVISAGFAWSNWNSGHLPGRNAIPRLHGDFMWQQFVNLRELNIKNAYVAMFDEFDEGTAIAKVAEDASMIPNNQYFLTLDADGVHVSSDFYLRLVDAGTNMLKGQTPLAQKHNVPFTK